MGSSCVCARARVCPLATSCRCEKSLDASCCVCMCNFSNRNRGRKKFLGKTGNRTMLFVASASKPPALTQTEHKHESCLLTCCSIHHATTPHNISHHPNTHTLTQHMRSAYKSRCLVNIRDFSTFQSEEELLLLPGTPLVVKSVLEVGNGLNIIQVQHQPSISKNENSPLHSSIIHSHSYPDLELDHIDSRTDYSHDIPTHLPVSIRRSKMTRTLHH